MSEVVCTQSRGECEDDFEKDLDWLISADQVSWPVSGHTVLTCVFVLLKAEVQDALLDATLMNIHACQLSRCRACYLPHCSSSFIQA